MIIVKPSKARFRTFFIPPTHGGKPNHEPVRFDIFVHALTRFET